VSLRIVEGQSEDVAVETCAECRCYIKYFREDQRPEIEPLADDVASYGLDLLVREEGFLRHAANPLMVTMG
jgi:FdhE protein